MNQEEKILLIQSHTNYTNEECETLLSEYNDPIIIIKKYLGIVPVKKEVKSVNQEIYKMLRKHIDISEFNKIQSDNISKGE